MLKTAYEEAKDKRAFINECKVFLHEISGNHNPVDLVQWIPLDKVQANDYNPNSVANNELKLLYTSISEDGYTQPIVAIYDDEKDKYIIVDGFHRNLIMRVNADIAEKNGGHLPLVVLKKSMNDRMASTVRHNRARGKHSITGMSNMVFEMLDKGWSDENICNKIGLEPDELLRLKHITGFSKLFQNMEYKKAWEMKEQLRARKEYEDSQKAVQ